MIENRRVLRLRMPRDVGQRFAHHPQGIIAHVIRQ